MKTVQVIGAVSLLTSLISGCNDSTVATTAGSGLDNAAILVGTWQCVTKGAASTGDMADSKTFSADGRYSSSKFPEGKRYSYRLEGDKLMVSMPTGTWSEKVTALTSTSLEYYSDRSGQQTKVSCQKN